MSNIWNETGRLSYIFDQMNSHQFGALQVFAEGVVTRDFIGRVTKVEFEDFTRERLSQLIKDLDNTLEIVGNQIDKAHQEALKATQRIQKLEQHLLKYESLEQVFPTTNEGG